MSYILQIDIQNIPGLRGKKSLESTKKFPDPRAVAKFLTVLCRDVKRLSAAQGDADVYRVFNGQRHYHDLPGAPAVIDFCLDKYPHLLKLNAQTGAYFSQDSAGRVRWAGPKNPGLRGTDYLKACHGGRSD